MPFYYVYSGKLTVSEIAGDRGHTDSLSWTTAGRSQGLSTVVSREAGRQRGITVSVPHSALRCPHAAWKEKLFHYWLKLHVFNYWWG